VLASTTRHHTSAGRRKGGGEERRREGGGKMADAKFMTSYPSQSKRCSRPPAPVMKLHNFVCVYVCLSVSVFTPLPSSSSS
jgi:hypothetical protein